MPKKIAVKANYKSVGGNSITMNLQLLSFEENGLHFIYSPSLNLTGYDATYDGAEKSFKLVLDEYIRYTSQKNTLHKDLVKHGWIVNRTRRKLKAPQLTDLLEFDDQLKELLNTKEVSTHTMPVHIPM